MTDVPLDPPMAVDPEVAAIDAAFVLPTYARLPLQIVSGSGSEVVGVDGRRYLDFVTGLSVCNFGHCHPRMVAAIQRQAAQLIHTSNLFLTEPQAQLARRLSRLANGGRVFFANSGAEANECALKIARKWGRERGGGSIVYLEHSFHGRTMGTLSATGQPSKQEPFGLPLPGYRMLPRHDIGALRSVFAQEPVAAFIAEPVQGESGVHPLGAAYLQEAQALCARHDALFIMDEVQTGLGRCGALRVHALRPGSSRCHAGQEPGRRPAHGRRHCPGQSRRRAARRRARHHLRGGPVPAAAALAVLDLLEEEDLVAAWKKPVDALKIGCNDWWTWGPPPTCGGWVSWPP